MKNHTLILLSLIVLLILSGCSQATPQLLQTVVVTVVNTVPVEVTRIVEVKKTVAVTHEVVVTQIVEVPVTVTPSPSPEISPTPEITTPPTAAFEILASPSPTFPQGKVQGFAPLKLVNQTADNLLVNIAGPFEQMYALSGESDRIETVMEGQYTYTVWRQDQALYTGSMNITNPDKHELHIRPDRVVFLVP